MTAQLNPSRLERILSLVSELPAERRRPVVKTLDRILTMIADLHVAQGELERLLAALDLPKEAGDEAAPETSVPVDRRGNPLEKPAVAPEFVGILAEQAITTLIEWTRDNAPEPVQVLADLVSSLWIFVAEDEAHPNLVTHISNREILGTVGDVINALAELGGTFHGPYSSSLPRERGHEGVTQ